MIAWSLFHSPLASSAPLCSRSVWAGQCRKLSLFCHLRLKGPAIHQLCSSSSPRPVTQALATCFPRAPVGSRPSLPSLAELGHCFCPQSSSGVVISVKSGPVSAQPSAPAEKNRPAWATHSHAPTATFGSAHVPAPGLSVPCPHGGFQTFSSPPSACHHVASGFLCHWRDTSRDKTRSCTECPLLGLLARGWGGGGLPGGAWARPFSQAPAPSLRRCGAWLWRKSLLWTRS